MQRQCIINLLPSFLAAAATTTTKAEKNVVIMEDGGEDGCSVSKVEEERSLNAADYVKLINIRTAKIAALLLVLSFGVYHGLLHLSYGVTPCKGLLEDGMFKGDFWQPWGCMMHKYSQS